MSITDTNPAGHGSNGGVKTLAIRLEPEIHQQLTLLAQLQGSTITDEIRAAINEHITTLKARPEIAAKADSALADIERDAATRRSTIAALFGSADPASADAGQRAGDSEAAKDSSASTAKTKSGSTAGSGGNTSRRRRGGTTSTT